MKNILIFGAGVIGSIYGGLLAKSGHKVSIYARNERLASLKEKGLLLHENTAARPSKIDVEVISELDPGNFYDYVIVTIRKEQVETALPVLAKVNTSSFVFMVNNASGYEAWTKILGAGRLIPAFPGAGGKIQDGIVYFNIVHRMLQPTTLGELSGGKTARILDLKKVLSEAGFPVAVSADMDTWQKSHVAMVASFAAVIYLYGGNNYTAAQNPEAIKQMNLALKENFRFLHNSGIGIEPASFHFFRFSPLWLLNFMMKQAYNTKWAEILICNHALNAKHEMELLNKEFLNLARGRGYRLTEFEKLTTAL